MKVLNLKGLTSAWQATSLLGVIHALMFFHRIRRLLPLPKPTMFGPRLHPPVQTGPRSISQHPPKLAVPRHPTTGWGPLWPIVPRQDPSRSTPLGQPWFSRRVQPTSAHSTVERFSSTTEYADRRRSANASAGQHILPRRSAYFGYPVSRCKCR